MYVAVLRSTARRRRVGGVFEVKENNTAAASRITGTGANNVSKSRFIIGKDVMSTTIWKTIPPGGEIILRMEGYRSFSIVDIQELEQPQLAARSFVAT